jgi:hypothetical protein
MSGSSTPQHIIGTAAMHGEKRKWCVAGNKGKRLHFMEWPVTSFNARQIKPAG